jgi:hypothetical protein
MRRVLALCGAIVGATMASAARGDFVGRHRLASEDTASAELATTASLAPSTEDVTAVHLAETLAASLRVGPRLALTLDATLGFTSFRASGRERRTTTRLGNPLLAIHLTLLDEPRHTVELGLGVAPPLVTAPGGLDANSAATFGDRVALEARGTQSPWLWSNNAVPIVLPAGVEVQMAQRLRIRWEVQPAYLISVNRRPSRVALDSTLRASFQADTWVPELALHGYTQSVPIRDGDYAQLSVATALRYERPRWWARGELAVNLDGPAGFGETNRTPWGVTLGVGARF